MKNLIGAFFVCTGLLLAQVSLQISPNTVQAGYTGTLTISGSGFNPAGICPTQVTATNSQGRTETLAILSGSSTSLVVSPQALVTAAGTWSITVTNRTFITPSGCSISGTPLSAGLTVTSAPFNASCNNPPNAQVGVPYTHRLAATGGIGESIWTPMQIASGVTLNAQGVISGVFSLPGRYPFEAVVSNSVLEIPRSISCFIDAIATAPSLISVFPTSATACGPGFTLTAVVQNARLGLNLGIGRSPEYVRLTTSLNLQGGIASASIGAELIQTPGSYEIIAGNPPNDPASFSNTLPFTIIPAPVVQTLSRSSAEAGSDAISIVANGLNFTPATRAYWTVGGVRTLLDATFTNASALAINIPRNLLAQAGAAQISVLNSEPANPNNTPLTCSQPVQFTVGPALPTISSLEPRTITACGPQFTLAVNGTNFAEGAQVRYNGVALQTTRVSATRLTAVITPDRVGQAAASVPITVSNPVPQGQTNAPTSAPSNLTVRSAPRITQLSQTSAPAGSPAVVLRITGTDFIQDVTTVRWTAGEVTRALPVTAFTPTQLTVNLPPDLLQNPVAGTVSVTNTDEANTGGAASTCSPGASFSVGVAVPTLIQLQPSGSPRFSPGVNLVVTGAGFTANSRIRVGSTEIPTTFENSTTVRGTVAGSLLTAEGRLPVTVVNTGGSPSLPLEFTVAPYVPPPLGVGVSATSNASQPRAVVSLDRAPGTILNGTLALRFTPAVSGLPGGYTGDIQFASGGTTLDFTITGAQTTVTLPQNGVFQTGTVAGAVRLELTRLVVAADNTNVLPPAAVSQPIEVPRQRPVIDSDYGVRLVSRSSSGFDVEFVANSTTRSVTQALLSFAVASGTPIDGSTELTVDLTSRMQQWYSSAESLPNGSAFLIRIPIAISGREASLIQSVTVRLRNEVDVSQPVTSR